MEMNGSYISNYDFVPYHPPEYYITPTVERRAEQRLNGYLDVKLACINPVYIGSGFSSHNKQAGFISETMKYDGKPVIPASSLKGVVRNIASAVSLGCLPRPVADRKKKTEEKQAEHSKTCSVRYNRDTKKYVKNLCIVCDMFGAMSYGSKVDFSDFTCEQAELILTKQKQQFSPDYEKKAYHNADGTSKGYKFYKTHCETNTLELNVNVEAIQQDSIFSGRIFFQKLSEQQLSLLLFSLGLDQSFHLKIGGWKNDNMGAVKMVCEKLLINGSEDDALPWAEKYAEKYGGKCTQQIAKLREILKP